MRARDLQCCTARTPLLRHADLHCCAVRQVRSFCSLAFSHLTLNLTRQVRSFCSLVFSHDGDYIFGGSTSGDFTAVHVAPARLDPTSPPTRGCIVATPRGYTFAPTPSRPPRAHTSRPHLAPTPRGFAVPTHPARRTVARRHDRARWSSVLRGAPTLAWRRRHLLPSGMASVTWQVKHRTMHSTTPACSNGVLRLIALQTTMGDRLIVGGGDGSISIFEGARDGANNCRAYNRGPVGSCMVQVEGRVTALQLAGPVGEQQSEVRLLAGTDSGCFFLVSLFAASSEPAKKIFLQARREAGGRIEGEG